MWNNDDDLALDARVLVAVVTRPQDLAHARQHGWYRVPVKHAPRGLAVDAVAFYQTAAFGAERWAVRWLAPLRSVSVVRRIDLLPDEPTHPRANERYYRLALGPLVQLPYPVPAARLRRVTFVTTTYRTLLHAQDVRELWERAEPLAGGLWGAGIGRG